MDYNQLKVKNVLVAGHAGSGKTSLVEALLYLTKTTDRLGKTDDGNTISDFETEEIKRKCSLSSTIEPYEFKDTKVNLVDVPGLFDFELGMYEGIKACETALITVSAKDGVEVGTQKAYKLCEKYARSSIIYVSKIDVEHADFYKVFEELKTEFGPKICPIVVPVAKGDETIYINLMELKAYSYKGGKHEEVVMPAIGHRFDGLVTSINEAVAETDDVLFEKYFSGEQFTKNEIVQGIRKGVKDGKITPVVCGSSTKLEGTYMLLEVINDLAPSPDETDGTPLMLGSADVVLPFNENSQVAAMVFKTVADPFVGKMSFVKVLSGNLKADSNVINTTSGAPERLGKLLFIRGKKQIDAGYIKAGDIGAVTKLSSTKTGDILCDPQNEYKLAKNEFPMPTMEMCIRPKNKGDEAKISSSLQRIMEEDCTVSYRQDAETAQQLIKGLGEQHLDVLLAKMKGKFGVEADLSKPKVAYRETIRKTVKAEGKHKKQSGGHGQYGHVWIEFAPTDSDSLVFEEKVFGGSVPKNYFPAVEKGLQGAIKYGVLAGYPVVGLKATLLDGSYHPVDSSEMAFKIAATLAYKAGLKEAGPCLLEPIGTLTAYVPETNTGDVMGEVNKRRGRVLGVEPSQDNLQAIMAECPMSEMSDFTTYIRSLTAGRGYFTFEFARYELLPSNLEAKVIEDAKQFIVAKYEEE
ncbi:MAG: elongation factor G [Oscillospiraceae bacterium]